MRDSRSRGRRGAPGRSRGGGGGRYESPPRRGGSRYSPPPRRAGSRSPSRGRGGSRYSPPARRAGSRYSPRRRSPSRGGGRYSPRGGREKAKSRSRSPQPKKKARPGDQEYRIPPPKKKVDMFPLPAITDEQIDNSIEVDGFLYATIDFTSPHAQPPWHYLLPTHVDPRQTRTDLSVTEKKTLPRGWEVLTSANFTERIREQIMMKYSWGTHLLVLEGGQAHWTSMGENPGVMTTIWDFEKYGGWYALKPRYEESSRWHAKFLIRRKPGS
eukprot:gb/GFBE01053757.1/.p1 GENE.gb/GFBE01053757.1/~~gb/GFBE01053757.1/.p1  ORF type:complete len:270 (+),score=9.26 gb/GFBE01053757.1/:1-810(+)